MESGLSSAAGGGEGDPAAVAGGAKKRRGAAPRRRRVLVTGATSTTGRQLCEKLLYDANVEYVWALSRRERPYYFRDFDPRKFDFTTCAPANERRLLELCSSDRFAEARIDTIVHLAFQVGREGSETEIHEYNIRGTQNLLEIARETAGIKKFVFLSSAKVYRLPTGHIEVLTEESPLNADPDAEPHVRDLVEADLLCQQEIGRVPRLKMVILRPAFVIGRNVHSFYSYYLDSPVCPRIAGHNPMVNLVHSADVVRALRMAVADKKAEGVYNIPGKETRTLKEYISFVGAPSFSVPEFAIEPVWQGVRRLKFNRHPFAFRAHWLNYNCVLSGARAKAELGYEPAHHVKFEES